MLQVQNLRKCYGSQLLFDEMSFILGKGERLGVCGRNGHGKTTLFRLILEEEEADGGEIVVPKGYRIGCVKQQLNFTEQTPLAEACKGLPPEDSDAVYKVEKILCGLGFANDELEKPLDSFSGGYHIRVNLAKALVAEPDLLLLDEPTNYLDIVSISWLVRYLRQWRGELMVITHDRSFMDAVCTHTLVIHRQKCKKVEGGTDKLYSQVLLEEEVHEKTRLNLERKTKQINVFIEKFRSKASKAKQVQSRVKALERAPALEELAALHQLDFAFPEAPFPAKVLLQAENLSFGYTDDLLFQGIGFTLVPGDRLAVIGKNGRGKSTLLKVLAGELETKSGCLKPHPKMQVGYFGQTNIDRLDSSRSIEDEIAATSRSLDNTKVRAICGTMFFEGDQAKKKISVLSGGERSRVLLGKLLAQPNNLLLLDEPTNHLDMESIESLVDSLEEYGGAVVLVTHSEMILGRLANKIIYFRDGNAYLFEGSYEEFLEKIGWSETPPPPKKPRKDDKRERAERQQAKSQALRPLKKRLTDLEEEIVKLEAQSARDSTALIDASSKKETDKIQKLSRAVSDAQARIEVLFKELEAVSLKVEEASEAFDEE